jgi:hypothetical protein
MECFTSLQDLYILSQFVLEIADSVGLGFPSTRSTRFNPDIKKIFSAFDFKTEAKKREILFQKTIE